MKRIFYFNITYGCNSNCIFCYSHNTRHNGRSCSEISADALFSYLEKNHIGTTDRVIINGGEPFLHSEISVILKKLVKYNCEVLIYTNGRLICNFDLSGLNANFRFVIPIHGNEIIHDQITGVCGSYRETVNGLAHLNENTECLVDVKLIINNRIISEDRKGKKTIEAFSKEILFNNGVHLTKMADTIVSARNKCDRVLNEDAARFMAIFSDYFKSQNKMIKIFDTCIKDMTWLNSQDVIKYDNTLEVYFKDKNQFRIMDLTRKQMQCMEDCPLANKCMSAVDEYKCLVFFEEKLYEDLE